MRGWHWLAIFKLLVAIGMRLADAQQLTHHAQDAINQTAFLEELGRITDENLGVSYMQVLLICLSNGCEA